MKRSRTALSWTLALSLTACNVPQDLSTLVTFKGTDPASPSKATEIHLQGNAPDGATVEIYTDAFCQGPMVKKGSAAEFASPGLALSVNPNSITNFYAIASEGEMKSPCSSTHFTYVSDENAPDAPKWTPEQIPTPANNNSPILWGTTEPGDRVELFLDSACQGPVLANTKADPLDGRFEVSVEVDDNSTTIFYARATDGAGNHSGCSAGFTFVEDAIYSPEIVLTGTTVDSPAQIEVKGTGEAQSVIRLFPDSTCSTSWVAQGAADAAGKFSVAVGVHSGSNSFYAKGYDLAGNPSQCSSGVNFVAP
ncbi:MAG: hypothetical protein ACXWPM_08155 [Bdellovibrionota bacterium]